MKAQFEFGYKNVVCYKEKGNKIAPWLKGYNQDFILRLLREIYILQGDNFYNYEFVICHSCVANNPVMPIKGSQRRVLFYVGDETSRLVTGARKYYMAIFKQYLHSEALEKIFPLPLGTIPGLNSLSENNVNSRYINVFFSGNLNANRVELFNVLNGKQHTPSGFFLRRIYCRLLKSKTPKDFSSQFERSCIQFTEGFAKGFQPEEYINKLENSKIVICPGGFVSMETIRHFEAMKAGCIIISRELPDTYLYRNSPIIILPHWKILKETITGLLDSPERMKAIQQETILWWKQVCSENAFAKYMSKKIEALS
jgi:hypothetical protein